MRLLFALRLATISLNAMAVAPSVLAATPIQAPVATSVVGDPAADLFAIMVDGPSLRAQTAESVELALTTAIAADPGFGDAEKKFPGITEAVKTKIRTEIAAWVPSLTAALQVSITGFLHGRLTDSELVEIGNFYRTPTGIRVLAAARDGVKSKSLALVADNAKSKATSVSADQMKAMIESAQASAIGAIKAEDTGTLIAFGNTSAAQKLAAVQPAFSELIRTTVNNEVASYAPVIKTKIAAFVADYVAQSSKR